MLVTFTRVSGNDMRRIILSRGAGTRGELEIAWGYRRIDQVGIECTAAETGMSHYSNHSKFHSIGVRQLRVRNIIAFG
jgi:hypothetical protein